MPLLAVAAEVEPWLYITCVAAAMFITGLGKAGFGGGVGIVVTPLMAMVVYPSTLVLAITLPAFVVGDICSVLIHKHEYNRPLLRLLLSCGVLGVILGAVALRIMQVSFADQQQTLSNVLALMIGSVSLIIVIMQLWRLAGRKAPQLPVGTKTTVFVGVFEAFLSTLTNSAGVLMALLLLRKQVSKQVFMTTVLWYFTMVNGLKFMMLWLFNGIITSETLATIAPYLPLVIIGAFVGVWLNRRIDAKVFTLILYALAIAAASRMILKVVLG